MFLWAQPSSVPAAVQQVKRGAKTPSSEALLATFDWQQERERTNEAWLMTGCRLGNGWEGCSKKKTIIEQGEMCENDIIIKR